MYSDEHQECDLGSVSYGDLKGYVDKEFSRVGTDPSYKCIICKQPAMFRLIPKHSRVSTAEIENKGFICQGCVSVGAVSIDDFGLRPL